MANFEDGSYSCNAGTALIAKVLAGRCQMRYTRAAVGCGKIPDDKTPKNMQFPADYVMDAMISNVSTPMNGECQVTVQISSSDVAKGFFATGIVLYAEDPDEGEVPYTYLVLENNPEWIRSADSAVGKLAVFDLITAVGDVENVSADIAPDAVVTRSDVEKLIDGASVSRTFSVPNNGWQSDADGYYIDLAQDDITENAVPFVTVLPESLQTAKLCGLKPISQTFEGRLRLFADSPPKAEIKVSLLLLRASGGRMESGSGTTSYINGMLATDSETNEMLNSIFNND